MHEGHTHRKERSIFLVVKVSTLEIMIGVVGKERSVRIHTPN